MARVARDREGQLQRRVPCAHEDVGSGAGGDEEALEGAGARSVRGDGPDVVRVDDVDGTARRVGRAAVAHTRYIRGVAVPDDIGVVRRRRLERPDPPPSVAWPIVAVVTQSEAFGSIV